MSSWLAPAIALLAGWVLIGGGREGGAAGRLVAALVTGVAAVGGWLVLLDVLGLGWSRPSLGLGGALVLAAGGGAMVRRRSRRRPAAITLQEAPTPGTGWAAGAAALAAAHAVLLAAIPAFGWDFRYIWGLKARVFAAAGGHAWSWLAWRPFDFAHPDYPPLWSDLVASGVVLGGSAGAVAAAWSALWAGGLALACWIAAEGAPAPVRALAAALGAWMPVVFSQSVHTSGSAEGLAAFLTAVLLIGVATAAEGRDALPWAAVPTAAAALALTKNEGMVLAVLLSGAGAIRLPRRRAWTLAGAPLAAALAWNACLVIHRVSRLPLSLDPAYVLRRLWELPGVIMTGAGWVPVALAAALVAGLAGLRGPVATPYRLVFAAWGCAVLVAYVAGNLDLAFHLRTSLARVIATPLPGVLALALAAAWTARAPASAPMV